MLICPFPAPNLKMSSGRSFIERLKERQRSKDQFRRRHSAKDVELPDDLVESFDIDYQTKSEVDETGKSWLRDEEQGKILFLFLKSLIF